MYNVDPFSLPRQHGGTIVSTGKKSRKMMDGKVKNGFVSELQDIIKQRFGERLTLDMLAKLVYVNPSYMSSVFKRHTGQTLVDYITEVRINEAKRLLATTNRNMGDIAAAIGLNSESYFAALFKRKVNMTPTQFRRDARQREIR